jgi:hypothetical protein
MAFVKKKKQEPSTKKPPKNTKPENDKTTHRKTSARLLEKDITVEYGTVGS